MRLRYQSRRYALMNTPIEVERHLRRVDEFLRPRASDRILEIGCGRGFLTRRVRRVAPATIGIDVNRQAVANGVTPDLRIMDACQLAFSDESFDKIYSFHVIEHIVNLSEALGEMARVLRPGGSILLVYPAEPVRGLYVVPTAIRLFGNPLRARDLHVHKLSPRTIEPFLAGTALRVVRHAFDLFLTPQFITVLRKEAASVRHLPAAV